MRTLITIVGILTAWSAAARAETASVAEELAPRREVTGLWWFDTLATGTTSYSTGAQVSPGGEVALALHAEEDGGFAHSFLFSRLTLDGHARLGAGGQHTGASAALRVDARVLQFRFMDGKGRIYELLPFDMYADVEQQAIPDLSSRRELWRRPYSRQVLGGSLSFGDMTGHAGLDFLRVGMEWGRFRQVGDMDEVRHEHVGFHVTILLYDRARDADRPAFHADIMHFGAKGIKAPMGPDAAVGYVDFLRLDGIELAHGLLYADLAGGFAGTGTMSSSGSSGDDTWSTTINTEDLPNTGSWTGRAHLRATLPHLATGLEAEKSLYLTANVELAIESRVAAYAEWRNRHGALTLRGFASRNKLWLDKETAESTTTGGLFASWQHPVGSDLSVITSVEVARSFYAHLGGEDSMQPASALGGQVFVTVAKHFGTHWRERRFAGP